MSNIRIYGICFPQTSASIAEPIDAQLHEISSDIIQMYHCIGIIGDEKVLGLGSILKYMNENSFSKDDPAINEHHYHIIQNNTTKKHITYTI